ncbi:MAG: glycosyltransferase, partial [Anaerolineales bacterium]
AFYYRRNNQEFDLGIAAFNEMDLGKAGIQYINVPLFGHGNEVARKLLKYPTSVSRTLYQRLCEWATGYSDNRMKRNFTLADSKWAGELVKRAYGLESQVLYPPVILCPPDIPWDGRENGFICSGRITPEKRIETVIEIIRLVRERGFDIHLHILGGFADPEYGNKIKNYCDVFQSWITMEGIVSRSDLALLLARHRYGIHGSISEAFGISVAEMICAGCIPFVPAGGGPAEIVGQDARLVYGNVSEAVEKIIKIIAKKESGLKISSTLKEKSKKFSADRFKSELLGIVDDFLNNPERKIP